MATIKGILKNASGVRPNTKIILEAAKTTNSVIVFAPDKTIITDANGAYSFECNPSTYKVTIIQAGVQRENVGVIQVYSDSLGGSLNDFLTMLNPDDVTPEIIKELELLRDHARESADRAEAAADNAADEFSQQFQDRFNTLAPIPWTPNTLIEENQSLQVFEHDGLFYLPNVKKLPLTTGAVFNADNWILSELATKNDVKSNTDAIAKTDKTINSGLLASDFNLVITCGTDKSATYDYSELADAILHASKYVSACKNDNSMGVQIVIPAGEHEFLVPIRLRGANLINLQIYADKKAKIKTPLGSSNTFFSAIGCIFGDLINLSLFPPTGCTITSDETKSCISTLDGSDIPYDSLTYFSFDRCFISRYQGITYNGNTDTVMLGNGAAFNGTTVGTYDDIECNNFREMHSMYFGCNIGCGYIGLRGNNIFTVGRLHESTFRARKVDATGAINPVTSKAYAGSAFHDSYRSDLKILSGTVSNFNYKYAISATTLVDSVVAGNGVDEFAFVERDGSTISTVAIDLPASLINSQNQINTIYNKSLGRVRRVEYVGGGSSQVIFTSSNNANSVKITVFDENHHQLATCLHSELLRDGNGNPLIGLSEPNVCTVYGPLNVASKKYYAIIE